ncbi:MAG: hypothetical protein ACK5HT_10860 [Draconibacterium sp.]
MFRTAKFCSGFVTGEHFQGVLIADKIRFSQRGKGSAKGAEYGFPISILHSYCKTWRASRDKLLGNLAVGALFVISPPCFVQPQLV